MNELADLPEAEEAPEVEETPAEETPPVDETPDPAALQSEIEALQAQKDKAAEDAKYWRRQKAEARADYFKGKREEPAPATAPEKPAPVPSSFDDYNAYVEAKVKFEVDQAKASWEADAQARAQNQEIQSKETELQAKIMRGFEKYNDFEDVALAETVPITPTIKDILLDSEKPEDVAYYLGKNRTEAIRISRMTPYQAARAIAQIELGMTEEAPQQPKKTVSEAPAPIKPVGSSGDTLKDPDKMSQAEFNAWRLSQGAKPY